MMVEEGFAIASDHPALAGHFPGNPIVPGSVLLDHAAAIACRRGDWHITGVRRAKFKAPLRPGVTYIMRLSPRDDGALNLSCSFGHKMLFMAILDYRSDDEKA